jgi:uncharacterized protein
MSSNNVSRRGFLTGGVAVAASSALFSVEGLLAREANAQPPAKGSAPSGSYGPLVPALPVNASDSALPAAYRDKALLSIPDAFQYTVFGVRQSVMDDGRVTPGGHDGMAAYNYTDPNTGVQSIRLVRNHEVTGILPGSAGSLPYDARNGGGCSTLTVDPITRLLRDARLTQSGTIRNCAGGETPWGSWITCEETLTINAASGNNPRQLHGYCFDVAVSANAETEESRVALRGLGRFNHEAVAVDPTTNFIYLSEDSNPGGLYRFRPNVPNVGGKPDFSQGGVLEMLVVKAQPRYVTFQGQRVGARLATSWTPINFPDADPALGQQSVVQQGLAGGGAIFSRPEGMWWANGVAYMACTDGGNLRQGQIFEFRPQGLNDGLLTLIYESRSSVALNNPDNLCVSPRTGNLVLCEDGSGDEYLHGLNRNGQIFPLAVCQAPAETGLRGYEFAGACFSPDGNTLFFNIQGSTSASSVSPGAGLGLTIAIFPKAGRSWSEGAL